MTNEIKEILDERQLRQMCNDIYEGGDWQTMIDYITNLQEENETLKDKLKRINFQLENAIKKENKTPEHISYLQGKKETLEMTIKEINWEETKILNNW